LPDEKKNAIIKKYNRNAQGTARDIQQFFSDDKEALS
jgi:hypothetical protein